VKYAMRESVIGPPGGDDIDGYQLHLDGELVAVVMLHDRVIRINQKYPYGSGVYREAIRWGERYINPLLTGGR